jgi:hypothetical protein
MYLAMVPITVKSFIHDIVRFLEPQLFVAMWPLPKKDMKSVSLYRFLSHSSSEAATEGAIVGIET